MMEDIAATPPPAFEPTHIERVIGAARYFPEIYAYNELRGYVVYRVVVDPQGKAISCTIVTSSRIKGFDEAACEITLQATRHSPARDVNGTAIYGVYSRSMNFVMAYDRDEKKPAIADIDLPMPRLAAEFGPSTSVDVNVLVDDAGKVEACLPNDTAPGAFSSDSSKRRPLPRSEKSIRADHILGPIACHQIVAIWKPNPVLNGGFGQRSVQTVAVRFSDRK